MALFYPSAIPSEPPLSSSSSLCRRRKYEYDVYLSFSGNDTRKNFADPIYMAMKGAGIDVFRYDKELQVGESISEKLLEAIECSRISVIIFSKDSAASSWCLEEVEKIIECWKTFQQPVLSIFYMVDLYCLVEAFAKHQGHFAADNLSRWREALTEAANLPGFKCIDGEETEFIESFLTDIFATLGPILLNERRDSMEIVDDGANGCQIGKLFVSDKEIALGRNGTVVYEGTYSGRPVAVKQLVRGHHVMASREILNLIESDEHQNIVRLYGEEKDEDFVYLALEQCTCNLADLIQIYSDYPSQNTQFSDEYNKVRLDWLDSVKVIMGDINLWKANGRPSPLLLELMRDVVSGLVHLHELGIIHGDLQPQNVLINIEGKSLRAKLSNTGIYKRLHPKTSSIVCGTSGWIAPEWLLHGRETRAMDLFSLGCVLFFCTTGGRHPFGDHFERDYHIEENQVDLSAVEYIPEAVDLFSHLLNPHPELRPKASEVLHHPLFWDSEKRLSFVRDTGDRVEWEAKGTYSKDLLRALENIAPVTFDALWDTKMEREFIDNILLHRRYKFDSVRDLLRVMRNKLNHYIELSKEIQCKVQTHFTPLRSSNPNHHRDCAAADPPYRRQYHPFRYSNHPCSCASYYGLMKIDSRGQIIHFAEKPKGADLKAMQVDMTLLGLSSQDALKSPYTASMGVYAFKTDILLKLLRRRYPTSNDFGSEIIPSAVMEHNVLEILGPVSEGFDDYFASRFPRLLLKYSKLWTNIVTKRNGFRSIISCVQKRNPSCGSI